MRRIVALFGVVALLLLGACGSDETDGSDEAGGQTKTGEDSGDGGSAASGGKLEVVTKNFSFDPASLKVDSGDDITVVLTNEDSAEHTFTIEELDVEAEAHGGETAQDTFSAPDGTYEFFCEYHPEDMRGTLQVGEGGGGAPMDGGDDPNNPNY